MSWIAVEVVVLSEASEAVESALNAAGALGTEIDLLGIKEPRIETKVIGYFDERPDEAEIRLHIADAFRIFNHEIGDVRSIEYRLVEEKDWLAEWKKHWRSTEVGRFIIAPPWEAIEPTGKIVIRIEPNMAFGTGTHETTRLCLEAIGRLYRPQMTFLDVGTGTGILAIATAKLARGATEIAACDTHIDSVRIACENAYSNGVGDDIDFSVGSISDQSPVFDFVCANLTLDVIIRMLPLLVGKTRSILLLSGILVEQKASIERELEKFKISDLKLEILGEWLSAVVIPK